MKQDTFERALKELPEGTNYDPYIHKTVEDLVFITQVELDLTIEEPQKYLKDGEGNMTDKQLKRYQDKLRKFINKYSRREVG